MSLRFGSFRPVLFGAFGAWIVVQSPAKAYAQSDGPGARVHHVEGLVGIALGVHSESDPAIFIQCPGGSCPPPPPDPRPVPGVGAGFRLGYRFRPVSFFELGLSAEVDRSEAMTFSAPLMAYFRHGTSGGTSFTFGLGGGITHVRAEGEAQTVGIVRAEIGAAVPISARWSISLLTQLSLAERVFRPNAKPYVSSEDNPVWLGFSLGPRYSF